MASKDGIRTSVTVENEVEKWDGPKTLEAKLEKIEIEKVVPENNSDSNCGSEASTFEAVDAIVLESAINSGILTQGMLEEEEKLILLSNREVEKSPEKLKVKVDQIDVTLEARYTQLQSLLTRSKFYTQYLVQKIETSKTDATKVKSKAQRKKEKKLLTYSSTVVTRSDSIKIEMKDDAPSSKSVAPQNATLSKSVSHQKVALSKCATSPRVSSSLKFGSPSRRRLVVSIEDCCKKPSPKRIKLEDNSMHQNLEEEEGKENKTEDDTFEQPKFLTGTLRDYQKEGYMWMKVLYENGINGILGDEMGLGKTIQCIALLAHLVEKGVQGPFLICAPLSTLPNWIVEFERFAPKLPVVLYHGTKPERTALAKQCKKLKPVDKQSAFPIIVTSYEIAIRDAHEFKLRKWKYIVIDEGHRIKNTNSVLLQRLKLLESNNRLLLTGTPLQNNLTELWSLLNFLMPEIFDDLEIFKSWFDASTLNEDETAEQIVAQEREKSILNTLHEILAPFLLRRVKADVDLNIPAKKELHVYATMTPLQYKLYKNLFDGTIKAFMSRSEKNFDKPLPVFEGKTRSESKRISNKDKKPRTSKRAETPVDDCEVPVLFGGTSFADVNVSLTNVFMQLRKCCYHPYLLEYPIDPFTQDYRVDEEIVTSSGKMLLLDAMLSILKERGHKVLIFSQFTKMLNILEDYCYYRGYRYCRLDGSRQMDDRNENISAFNSDPEIFIFLISTRAGGLGINLTAADTVILFDSDWNPQCDLQAMARCHRIGQTKPVIVYRLITGCSIDQKIVERAAGKRKLEKMIIQKGRFKTAGSSQKSMLQSLGPDELFDLLKSSDHDGTINSKGRHVFTREEIDVIFNRDFTVSPSATNEQALRLKVISENAEQQS